MKGKGKGKCAGGDGCWAVQGQIGGGEGIFLEKKWGWGENAMAGKI